MLYKTHNETDDIDIDFTSLKGSIKTSYNNILNKLGPSQKDFDNSKVDAEWTIEWEDGEIATLYNWKNGRNYCGNYGDRIEDIINWNIGGFNHDIVSRLYNILNTNSR
jgi:hypothetical protein